MDSQLRTDSKRVAFASLQVLRGTAALMVVMAHGVRSEPDPNSPSRLPGFFDNLGFAGVDLFFCLSGLIMYHVHVGGIGQPGEACRFLWRRFSRIYPVYWFALATWIWVQRAGIVPLGFIPADIKTWLIDFWLLPRPGSPILPPAWTLRHELRFYVLFAGLLMLPPRVAFRLALGATLISAGWLGLEGVLDHWPPKGGALAALGFVFHPTNLEFAAGAFVGHAWHVGWLKDRRWLVALPLGLAGLMIGCLLYDDGHLWVHDAHIIYFGAPAALVLWGLGACEAAGPPQFPRWMVWMGDISYALYLFHQPVVQSLFLRSARWWGGEGAGYFALLVVTPAAVLVAGLVHVIFERPVLRWCRRMRWFEGGRGPVGR